MKMKYVIMDNIGPSKDCESFFIFSEIGNHKKVAESLGGVEHVISAGFVSFRQEDNGIEASCYGISTSLGLSARKEEDSRLITSQMRDY